MSISETTRGPLADELDGLLRELLKRAMLSRRMTEESFARELSGRSGRNIKPGLVHAWRAETKHRWHLPADLVPIICEILGDDSIQRILLSDKLRSALDLGESAPRVASLLRKALIERNGADGRKKTERRSNR